MNRTHALAAGALALLTAGGLFFAISHPRVTADSPEGSEEEEAAEPVPVTTIVARTGRVTESVDLTGKLQLLPQGRAKLAPQVAGRLVSLSAAPGQRVVAGEILAVVEHRDLSAEVAKAQAAVDEARRETQALRSDLAAQEAAARSSVQVAEAGLEAAKARRDRVRAGSRLEEIDRARANVRAMEEELRRLQAGPRPQEVAQAQAAVRDAAAEVEARQRDADRKLALFDKGIVAGKDRDRAVADLAQAKSKLESAREAESLLRAGPRPEEVRAAEARLEGARSELKLAQAGSRPEEIQEAEAAVGEAQAKVEEAKAALRQLASTRARVAAAGQREVAARAAVASAAVQQDRSSLRAPFSGVVADVSASVGEQVSSAAPILELVNPDALRALVQVPTDRRALVAPGTPLELRLTEDPASKVTATVHHLSPGAEAESGSFLAEVWLPRVPAGWKDGLLVRATVRRPAGRDLVLVPKEALFDRSGEHYVYVVEDGKAVARKVDVQSEDASSAAIASGLTPGEKVIADGSLSLGEETPVTEGDEKEAGDRGKPGTEKE